MENFKYITRGMANPDNKQKIYYTAHEKDHELFMYSIVSDILELKDCSIWYKDKYELANDDLSYLDLMQLIVIPITKNFLFEENFARCRELKYAIEHNIPILPLIQENNLEIEFNKICGDFHCLNKNNVDSTQISFIDKLNNYLGKILSEMNMNEYIFDSFEGNFFLSYRKKDRKYAQKLMNDIHSNKELRKYGIWYDEFLIPGEDYSETIEQNIKECDLFIICVTPHILEDNNYVLNIEYPLALKYNKKVVFVEMDKTDKCKVKELYKDFEDYFEINNIRIKINKQRKREYEDGMLEHLLGMAYQYGIGVEKNIEIAIEYYETSHNMNNTASSLALSQIYFQGIGVNKDFDKACGYLSKASFDCIIKMTKEKTPESLKNVMMIHNIHGEYLLLENKYDEARRKYSVSNSNYRLLKNVRTDELEKLYLQSEEKIGDIYYLNKQYKESIEKYESLIRVYTEKYDFYKLSILCSKLIDGCMAINDLYSMRAYAELGVKCFEYAENNTEVEIVIRHYDSIYGLGKVFYLEGDFVKAIELFEKAKDAYADIYSKLYKDNDFVNSINKIIDVNYFIANSYVKLGNHQLAIDYYDNIKNKYNFIYKEDFENTNEYIRYNYEIAKAYIEMKKYAKVVEHSLNIIKHEKEILPKIVEYPIIFIELYLNNALANLNLNDNKEFSFNYTKASSIIQNEQKRAKTDISKQLLMMKHVLGLYYWKNNDNSKALEFYYSALRDSKAAYDKNPGNRTSCDLVFHHYSLAEFMKEQNDNRRYQIYEIIYAGASKLHDKINQYDTLTYIIESCLELISIEESSERRKEIIEFTIKLCEKIMKVANNDFISNKYEELNKLLI